MSKKDREPKQNLGKLVSQVKVLSKTVDELEKEIEALKSNICRNKNKKPMNSSSEPKKITNSASKTSSPFRLNFFRKNDKTKENVKSIELSKNIDKKTILRNKSPSNLQPPSGKNYADDSSEAKKNKRKAEFTQTRNHSTQIIRPRTQSQVQVSSKSDTCGCKSREKSNSLKKSKADDKNKIKSRKKNYCADDCPYLPTKTYYDDTESKSRRPFKNKKLMVNLIGGNRDFKGKSRRNKNFVLDCKFLQNADFGRLTESKDERRRRKIKLFGESSRDCKHCSKSCRTKNVLKIRKAILTQEPPMIFVSPDLESGKLRSGRKKRKKRPEDCCEDCCSPSGSGRPDHDCGPLECPCSSLAAAIIARCNKSCQTEISKK